MHISEEDWWICFLCGKHITHSELARHIIEEHNEWYSAAWVSGRSPNAIKRQLNRERIVQPIRKYPLKPWKDPDSLFCDNKFLKKYLGKEVTEGTDCKKGDL